MTASRPSKPAGAPGVKTFITAASLAATLGGWALLTLKPSAAADAATPTGVPPAPTRSVVTLNLPPLPTLVPAPDLPAPVIGGLPSAPMEAGAPAGQPALRQVSAPPPVTNTGSSRP